VDFSRVKERRAARGANPAATSPEAEAIFAAVEPLIADGATDEQKQLAVALGTVAGRLPHGERRVTIEKLISLSSRRARPKLLLNLILSGSVIDSQLVVDGIAETFEAAKRETWILTQSDAWELRQWLWLLPFTSCPVATIEVVRGIPDAQRQPRFFKEMLDGLAETPSDSGEEVLFELAEEDPRFYQNYEWRAAALKLGTASAARHLIDLTANGTLDSKSFNDWRWSSELGMLMAKFPEVRCRVHDLLRGRPMSQPLTLLARAVSESLDTEGLLLLIDIENKQKRSFLDWRTIENFVTEHVPVENWSGAYNVVAVPVAELRRQLLAKTTDGGSTDAAARCLNAIDAIRDEHGLPMSEPRHPNLASGKPWPIMTPDPDAVAEG
jgi:hypothetical protein